MEPFDVLNMGNISDFYLEHSNLYFFTFFEFQDPIISLKKMIPNIGFMVLKTTGFEHKDSFGKIEIGSIDICEKVRNV